MSFQGTWSNLIFFILTYNISDNNVVNEINSDAIKDNGPNSLK